MKQIEIERKTGMFHLSSTSRSTRTNTNALDIVLLLRNCDVVIPIKFLLVIEEYNIIKILSNSTSTSFSISKTSIVYYTSDYGRNRIVFGVILIRNT